nr:hypothetical protein [Thioalkalivibrio sp.]
MDRSETAKTFACKAGPYKGKGPWECVAREGILSAGLPRPSGVVLTAVAPEA